MPVPASEVDVSDETPTVVAQPEPVAEPPAEPVSPPAPQQPEPSAEPPEGDAPLSKQELARASREDGRKIGEELKRIFQGEEPIEEPPAGEPPAGEELAADEINPETGEHIRWQDGDPSGTYRDERGALHYASGPMKGKFASPETGGGQEPKEAPAVEGRAAETPGEAPAAPQLVTIPLPDDHPVRLMGVEQLVAADPEQEQALRALVNGTYYRRQDVEVLQRQLEAMQLQQMQTEASREAEAEWMNTPEYKQAVEQYHEILDMQGEAAAQRFWKGMAQEFQNLAEAKYQERMGAYELAQSDAAANAWANQTFQRFSQAMPQPVARLPEFRQWFAEELELFNTRIEAGHIAPRSAEELNAHMWELLKSRIAREPKAQGVLRAMDTHARNAAAQREAALKAEQDKKVAAQAVADFKKGAATTRTRIPPSPLSRAPSTSAPAGRSTAMAPNTGATENGDLSPQQLRREARRGAREDARRYLGTLNR